MSGRSNRQILTQGEKYLNKKLKKFGTDEVTFDKDSRLDFLTGFHKRKVQRQKKAQEFIKEQERQAKIEERKKIRDERKNDFEGKMKEFERNMALQFDSELDDDSEDDEDKEKKSKSKTKTKKKQGKDENDDYENWEGFGSEEEGSQDDDKVRPILKKQILDKSVYGEDTTVEIESLEPNDNFEYLAKVNNVKLEKAEKILNESITRATKYAKFLGMSDKDEENKVKKAKQKKKKFRYLTKTERKVNQIKANSNKRRK
ncbi:hypothetical protein Kpol_363p7 [Vanderwaltozyma polyspora DSM 70294]|uniref:Ribosomal RNA-processing protein 17 n=1 Tax=Vanderwaltozyma polyspora (strain ATCC 22028 / DSM 70294 / BCRC 21397 / CBS 2163 / NBRC 10782 / NRRL Y-8283 / UCD 57-17) TaxID=436907 RepID=A7TS90_VANPO|nr:uncharacterized protein Kpol_363p7 [Vanderwaltozyma polyspora DSM 70294]EDO14867.1 hypothetical protein Kpol_363p7 [Vanderwaltozyma polyspora DSM 70294]